MAHSNRNMSSTSSPSHNHNQYDYEQEVQPEMNKHIEATNINHVANGELKFNA